MTQDPFIRAAKEMMPEYTPAQAALITGVSVDLQRDWRRRGYLNSRPDGKHNRYTFRDLCLMFAFKAFSDAGLGPRFADEFDVRNADTAAKTAISAIEDFANYENPQTYRYVIAHGNGLTRTPSLAEYERQRSEKYNNGAIMIIFDCKNAAHEIMSNIIEMDNRNEIAREGER